MRIRRFVRQLALLGLLIVGAGVLAGGQWGPPVTSASARTENAPVRAGQTGTNQAALVIRFSDSRVVTKCVSFTETQITGDELLQKSGLAIGMSVEGTLCSIDNQGCPSEDCWCQCPFPQCQYWAYYHMVNGAWVYSSTGAPWFFVTNGTVEGWSWSNGDGTTGVQPPVYSFEQICAASSPTNTPTATVTLGVTPTPTATATQQSNPQGNQPTTQPGQVAPPQVSFSASTTAVAANGCAVLTWTIWDATQSTLNGAPVTGQDRQEVCPTSTQRYVLTAVNAGGQTTREILIQVTGSAGVGQSPLATPIVPSFERPGPATQVPPAQTPLPAGQLPAAQQPPGQAPVDQTGQQNSGDAALGPQAVPAAQPDGGQMIEATPIATVYYTLATEPTATPRPRRILGADQPTPTPILLARAGAAPPPAGESAAASSAAADGPPRLAVESRAFDPDLLPGYAVFLLAAASLLAAGLWIVRRKATPGSER